MSMETFSLADDRDESSQRDDLTPREICETRLLRTDLGPRRTRDPLQRHIHKIIRSMRVRSFMKSTESRSCDTETGSNRYRRNKPFSACLDSILIAGIIGRFVVALLTASFLIVPLTISVYQESRPAQLCTIGISVLVFTMLVSFSISTSNHETMAISSAYAAVLSVIVSNGFA